MPERCGFTSPASTRPSGGLDPATLSLPFLEREAVEAVVNDHLDGRRNHTAEIHKLLTVELVHRLFTRRPVESRAG
ncbi:MAG: hypothetical protein ACREQQ_08850 [Candidatus Binatia bacterium]